MFGIGTQELLLILLVVLLLFGARRIPSALGGLGKGIRELKRARVTRTGRSQNLAHWGLG